MTKLRMRCLSAVALIASFTLHTALITGCVSSDGKPQQAQNQDETAKRLELYTAYKTKANEYRRKIEGTKNPQAIAAQLTQYLYSDAKSPYKGVVFEAARLRCNKIVSDTLSSPTGRKENFERIFQSVRHLAKTLDGKMFCEGQFGDNALYWLAQTTYKNGKMLGKSSDWLHYTFHCDAVAVRTDHASENPGAKRFDKNVDAMLNLSFESEQDGYPKDIGAEGFLRYAKNGGERNIADRESWIPIPNSRIDIETYATDILTIEVKPGKEDWMWDVDIPGCKMDFWLGWGNNEDAFTYVSNKDIYPQVTWYGVHLLNVCVEGGPKQAFEDALAKANARGPAISAEREKEVSDADNFLKTRTFPTL